MKDVMQNAWKNVLTTLRVQEMKRHPSHFWRNPLIMFVAILLVVPAFKVIGLDNPLSTGGVVGVGVFVLATWTIAFVLGCSVDWLSRLTGDKGRGHE
jgi:putative effector of murein hydrolase LrgA (UPF0299 family)